METDSKLKNGHIQILIAEGYPIYADSLRALLETELDFRVIGIATDLDETVKLSREKKPDLLLLNVDKSPNKIGMAVLEELHRLNIPAAPLLLASSFTGPDLKRALLLGARGVVLKTSPSKALLDGIRGVMNGQYWIGAEIGASMIEALQDHSPPANGSTSKGAFGLTPREQEIITTVVAGYSNAEIARKYGISEQTVKHHLSSIFDRVGVFNRLELALFAVNHRLVSEDS